jgi:hypothetical protein
MHRPPSDRASRSLAHTPCTHPLRAAVHRAHAPPATAGHRPATCSPMCAGPRAPYPLQPSTMKQKAFLLSSRLYSASRCAPLLQLPPLGASAASSCIIVSPSTRGHLEPSRPQLRADRIPPDAVRYFGREDLSTGGPSPAISNPAAAAMTSA